MERATKRKVMTKALRRLAKGEPMRRAQMVQGLADYAQQKGGIRPFLCSVVNRLKEQDLIVEDDSRYLLGDSEKLKAIIADADALTNLFWPGSRPEPEPVVEQDMWPSPDVRQRVIDGAVKLVSFQGIVSWIFTLIDGDPEAASAVLDDIRQEVPLLAKTEPWFQKTAKAIDIAVHEADHTPTPDHIVNPPGGPEYEEPAPIDVDEAVLKMMYAVMKSNEEILERLTALEEKCDRVFKAAEVALELNYVERVS